MNHLDLFSGIGGFSLAIKRSGITHGWHGYSDIDKYANNIFRRHFNEAEKLGGIESIQPRDLPKLDLVTFGFPCQDLSVAGKGGGLRASRSGLFFEAMRIIRAKRPRYIIFENVKGLLSSQGGSDFVICLQEIANAGYDGQWQLCNTRWVLPQNRERVFFIGHLRGERRPKVFPIESKSETSKRELGREVSPCLTARDYKGVGNTEMALVQVGSVANGDAGRVFDPKGISCTLKSEGGGWGAKTGLYKVNNKINVIKNLKGEGGHECHNVHDPNGIAPTVRENHGKITMIEKPLGSSSIRRLTPTECERLQGFPDGWTEGQSDTQRYKQLGNAVSVPIVQEIIERLKKEI
jgi:DNA (cytosine-5)-methyltransferase 1